MKKNRYNITSLLKVTLVLASISLLIVLIVQIKVNNEGAAKNEQHKLASASTNSITSRASGSTSILEITNYEEIVNRPLFHDDRKPVAGTSIETEKQPGKHKKKADTLKSNQTLSLTAIVITPKTRLAIMQAGKSKALQRLTTGESINDWTLTGIQDRSVILKSGKETQTVELEVKTSNQAQKTKTIKAQ